MNIHIKVLFLLYRRHYISKIIETDVLLINKFSRNILNMKRNAFTLLVSICGLVLFGCSNGKPSERKSSDTTYFESDNKVDSFYTRRAKDERYDYRTAYFRNGDKWKFRQATTTRRYPNFDTIAYDEGTVVINAQLKPLRKIIFNKVTGDTLIEVWQYNHQVDSLKSWGQGVLYLKKRVRMDRDGEYVYYPTDTLEINFLKYPNTLNIQWSSIPNLTGKKDYVSILREKKDFGFFNRIERHGVFQSADPQLYSFVSQYYDGMQNIAYQFIAFYDRNGHAIRSGQIYFPDEKTLKEIDTLVHADYLTITQLNGVLHGLWSYYVTTESGIDAVADTKAFFQGSYVGNSKKDFVNARYNDEKKITREITGSSSNAVIGGKCSWCKVGTYLNGTCNKCGTVSEERERELKEKSFGLSKKIEECPYRSTHHKIQFPYTCDCGYVGK
jgi:hypothetical protein